MKVNLCSLCLTLLVVAACTPKTVAVKAPKRASLRLELPAELEPRREALERDVEAALDHVLRWFAGLFA